MFGFIISVVCGAATPMLEGPVAKPVAAMLSNVIELDDTELRLLAFMLAMVIAAILCVVFGTGSLLGLIIGGMLGYFGARLVRWGKTALENRRG